VVDNNSRMLMEAILDYERWVKSVEERRRRTSYLRYTRILIDFLFYVIHKSISWEDMFTFDILDGFQRYSGYKGARSAIGSLSDYLYKQGRTGQSLRISRPKHHLPDIYEDYLLYHKQSLQVSQNTSIQVRRILVCFHEYMKKRSVDLPNLKLEHLDSFLAEFKVVRSTLKTYRHHLRGFLKYLYHERRIIKKDLARLLVGPPMFAQSKPPKFLRPEEVKRLFLSLKIDTPFDMRTYAIVHLTYSLGLRPGETTKITFDDIFFRKGEIRIKDRKPDNSITLPIPEQTIKAIALYVTKARPQSDYRHLFLTFHPPFRPIDSGTVRYLISKVMRKAGLNSSPHWLRHTYAQNLLEMGRNIYEIKEMLGHQNIQSSRAYLNIHTKLMRKVLFNEKL
jgi:site-specific recombinase XerD